MILGLPVIDGHKLTQDFVKKLVETVEERDSFKLVIIDNASEVAYTRVEFGLVPFELSIVRNKKNLGYYYPLNDLYEGKYDPYIGLCHNDVIIYEKGWDRRIRESFEADPKLGLIGFAGSNEIDSGGGRGAGTMLRFRGKVGEGQGAGKFIDDLRPSVVFDSLFMMFRSEVIPALKIDDMVTLAHFYDRIWSCRVIEAGWRAATLGIEIDHIGGQSTLANMRYREDCIRWLNDRGITFENPETEMYLVGQRAFLNEYREEKKMIPCIIQEGHGQDITFTARAG